MNACHERVVMATTAAMMLCFFPSTSVMLLLLSEMDATFGNSDTGSRNNDSHHHRYWTTTTENRSYVVLGRRTFPSSSSSPPRRMERQGETRRIWWNPFRMDRILPSSVPRLSNHGMVTTPLTCTHPTVSHQPLSSSSTLPTPSQQGKQWLEQIRQRIKDMIKNGAVTNKPKYSKDSNRIRNSVITSTTVAIDADVENDIEATWALQRRLIAITQPLIPTDVWSTLTGMEFQEHPDRLDALTQTGYFLAQSDQSNDWVEWKKTSGSDQPSSSTSSSMALLEEGAIEVWTGKCKREGYGSQIPFIKTRSIVPLSAEEMVDLLMDSDRVKTYNPWSLGRKDCYHFTPSNPHNKHDEGKQQTKIVKNRTQPPLGSKPMVSVTLLHARRLPYNNSWIVVSRSIGGTLYQDPEDMDAGRSDILLGVNLLQPRDDDTCLLTAVTHVYSSAVPVMLAERLGVTSAIKFVKDMRAVKALAAN